MIRALTAVVVVLLTLCAFPSIGSADAVTWTLVGVTFSDGSTASGSFVFNADGNGGQGTLISANIVTSIVSPSNPYAIAPPGFQPVVNIMTPPTPNMTEIGFVQGGMSDLTGAPILDLIVNGMLTDSGGSFTLNVGTSGGSELVCSDAACDSANPNVPPLDITGGKVMAPSVATPEPPALLLLGLGMGLAAIALRKSA
jgi:hypothetical protein